MCLNSPHNQPPAGIRQVPRIPAGALPSHPGYLLISSSARAMAQSAVRAGFRPLVLDLYADEDTQAVATGFAKIPPGATGFDADSLLRAADRLAPRAAGHALIYGSGFERNSALLRQLSRSRTLYGNPPEVVRRVNTPRLFFGLLDRLQIPYPEVSYRLPDKHSDDFLIKPAGGTGGRGVDRVSPRAMPYPHYFQRRLDGPAYSALFLADRKTPCLIGFNTLWTYGEVMHHPFLFAGAINHTPLTDDRKATLRGYLQRLVPALHLRGLNSLDFMLDGDQIRVLEINPRPSATQILYEADFPDGLLAWHVAACRGLLPDTEASPALTRAFRVLFSPRPFRVPERLSWPAWCADRPASGSVIERGQPICTLFAEAEGVKDALASIKMRQIELLRQFNLADA